MARALVNRLIEFMKTQGVSDFTEDGLMTLSSGVKIQLTKAQLNKLILDLQAKKLI